MLRGGGRKEVYEKNIKREDVIKEDSDGRRREVQI